MDGRRPPEPEQLDREEPHRTRPEDEGGLRPPLPAVDRTDRAREGFDEGAPLEIQGWREPQHPAVVDVPPGDAEGLREPSGLEIRRAVVRAHRRAPAAARRAPPARDVVVREHPHPLPDPLDALPDLRDDADRLVSDHGRRGGVRAADLLEVGPAQAARPHRDDDLPEPRLGDGDVLHDDASRPPEERGLHGRRRTRGAG